MTPEKLQAVINEQINHIHKTLLAKSKEYATDQDKLHNFKKAAMLQNITIPSALSGMMTKHIVSIYDIIENYEKSHTMPVKETLDEKIGDAINYLILLKACFAELSDWTLVVEKDNALKIAMRAVCKWRFGIKNFLLSPIGKKDNQDL